jgi:hypothetical protein
MSIALISELFPLKTKFGSYNNSCLSDFNPTIHTIHPNIYIGIEVEIENCAIWHDIAKVWLLHDDGSLRNDGHEYVSVPLRSKLIPQALMYLFSKLNSDIHFSQRTSNHIHVNVQSLTLEQLCGVIITYLAVESLLYKWIGRDRDKSIFCVPLYETELPARLVPLICKNLTTLNFNNARYSGLNLDSIRKFGTLEFRHLYGTNDIPTIVTWINLILSIYHYGSTTPFNEVIERISQLNTNSFYIAFVNDVFGPLASKLDLSSIKIDMERGVKAVKTSLIPIELQTNLKINFAISSLASLWIKKYSINYQEPGQKNRDPFQLQPRRF